MILVAVKDINKKIYKSNKYSHNKLIVLVAIAITCTRAVINAHLTKYIAVSAHTGTWNFMPQKLKDRKVHFNLIYALSRKLLFLVDNN